MHFSSPEDNTRMEARAKSAHKEEKRKRGGDRERRGCGDNRQESGGEQLRRGENREM